MVGGWFGARAVREHTRAAVAYSQIPSIVLGVPSLILLILQIAVLATGGSMAFFVAPVGLVILLFFGLIGLVLGVWGFVIFLNCLAVAHQYTAWHALGTTVIGVLIVVAAILALVMPIVFLVR